MNRVLAADALNQISEGFAKLALAIEQPGSGQSLPVGTASSARGVAVQQEGGRDVPPVPAALPPSLDELPPEESFALNDSEEVVPTSAARPAVKPFEEKAWDVCPKHGVPWKAGQYGPYCATKTDDPAWANKKGWCAITPKTAAKWVEIQRATVA